MDMRATERAVTPKTRAILAMHYGGVACDILRLQRLCDKFGLDLVEDAAHCVGATHNGGHLGTFGRFGVFSFHNTKNISCGEGGALLINNNADIPRAEIVREKGTNRKQFLDGQVDKYNWQDVGSSFVLSEVLAAILSVQLASVQEQTVERLRLFNRYADGFAEVETQALAQRPSAGIRNDRHNAHVFYLMLTNPETRGTLLAQLRAKNIAACGYYVPLHDSPAGQRLGRTSGTMTNTVRAAASIVRLPLYVGLTEIEQQYVISVVSKFLRTQVQQVERSQEIFAKSAGTM